MSKDERPTAKRPAPSNKLSEEERSVILETCNSTEFASYPPGYIVPTLADDGLYIGSGMPDHLSNPVMATYPLGSVPASGLFNI